MLENQIINNSQNGIIYGFSQATKMLLQFEYGWSLTWMDVEFLNEV